MRNQEDDEPLISDQKKLKELDKKLVYWLIFIVIMWLLFTPYINSIPIYP